VQIALKPASKALGLHGVFKRGKGLKYLIANSAFKRMQVNGPGACWLDANEHHLGLALRTGGLQGNGSFHGFERRFRSKNPLRRSDFSDNSLCELTGKIFRGTGNFLSKTGNFACNPAIGKAGCSAREGVASLKPQMFDVCYSQQRTLISRP
jgi:hypothetical protein